MLKTVLLPLFKLKIHSMFDIGFNLICMCGILNVTLELLFWHMREILRFTWQFSQFNLTYPNNIYWVVLTVSQHAYNCLSINSITNALACEIYCCACQILHANHLSQWFWMGCYNSLQFVRGLNNKFLFYHFFQMIQLKSVCWRDSNKKIFVSAFIACMKKNLLGN